MKAIGALHSALPTRIPVWASILLVGVAAGMLDLLLAIGWWTLRDVDAIRTVQGVAAWVIGREAAFAGGVSTALFGVAFHCYLMTAMVAGYFLASRNRPMLVRHPLGLGALYGAAMFVLQHLVVLPLFSAAPAKEFQPDWMLACLVAYALLLGIPGALLARHWHGTGGPH